MRGECGVDEFVASINVVYFQSFIDIFFTVVGPDCREVDQYQPYAGAYPAVGGNPGGDVRVFVLPGAPETKHNPASTITARRVRFE